MPRSARIGLGILALLVLLGVYSLRGLRESITRQDGDRAERQARREVTQPSLIASGEAKVKARILWATPTRDALAPVEIELPLVADPVGRAKQVMEALITRVPQEAQRTLPADLVLHEFYLLDDGSAIADFGGALASATPSGILSEQLAVDSITRTLAANVPGIRRLKILIDGVETETLAGHVDLTGFFELSPGAAAAPAVPPPASPPKLP
jgi:hypothetical protein